MKTSLNNLILLVLAVFGYMFLVVSSAQGENLDLKDVAVSDGEGTTTIQIKKDKNTPLNSAKVVWETTEGTADIEGDAGVLIKQAKQNWKDSCKEWEKNFRLDNKENKIISISCGIPLCKEETGSKVCRSQIKYKIRTRIDQ